MTATGIRPDQRPEHFLFTPLLNDHLRFFRIEDVHGEGAMQNAGAGVRGEEADIPEVAALFDGVDHGAGHERSIPRKEHLDRIGESMCRLLCECEREDYDSSVLPISSDAHTDIVLRLLGKASFGLSACDHRRLVMRIRVPAGFRRRIVDVAVLRHRHRTGERRRVEQGIRHVPEGRYGDR